jgi:hypothetical protein
MNTRDELMRVPLVLNLRGAISITLAAGCLIAMTGPASAASLLASDISVGRGLQKFATIKLSEPAPEGGIEITVKSDDPRRLQFARRPDAYGSPAITVPVRAGFRESPEFSVYGVGDEGEVSYTASANLFGEGKGNVTITPSAVVVVGPFKTPSFTTSSRGEPSRITVYAVRLDPGLQVAEQQFLAGGLSVDVELTSSNPEVGQASPSTIKLAGGNGVAVTEFKPVAQGKTTLSINVPPGFSRPAERTSIEAVVTLPKLALTEEVMIGENLQIAAMVGLSQFAPKGGVTLTLTSSDPSRLILSATATEVGAESIKITIPEGGVNTRFYLQALAKSGSVEYAASAPGFESRSSKVRLAPSGVLLTPSPYGPPDEAEVLRPESVEGHRGYIVSLSKHKSKESTVPLVLWTAHLDPATLRGADITVQPLRAGMSLKLDVVTSDPAVGSIQSPVVIAGGTDHAGVHFKPLRTGSTVIEVNTPANFTKPSNSTTLATTIRD